MDILKYEEVKDLHSILWEIREELLLGSIKNDLPINITYRTPTKLIEFKVTKIE